MRLLNMNQLPQVRRGYLAGMKRIGQGQFANVYEVPDREAVRKLTTDPTSYSLTADWVWLEMREHVEQHFPRVFEDFSDVAEVNGATVYLVEVERLLPVRNTPYRKLIKGWIEGWECFLRRPPTSILVSRPSMTLLSQLYCEKVGKEGGAFADVFAALADFFGNYGGKLDLKISNFMVRPGTQELVFNDVVSHAGKLGLEHSL